MGNVNCIVTFYISLDIDNMHIVIFTSGPDHDAAKTMPRDDLRIWGTDSTSVWLKSDQNYR